MAHVIHRDSASGIILDTPIDVRNSCSQGRIEGLTLRESLGVVRVGRTHLLDKNTISENLDTVSILQDTYYYRLTSRLIGNPGCLSMARFLACLSVYCRLAVVDNSLVFVRLVELFTFTCFTAGAVVSFTEGFKTVNLTHLGAGYVTVSIEVSTDVTVSSVGEFVLPVSVFKCDTVIGGHFRRKTLLPIFTDFGCEMELTITDCYCILTVLAVGVLLRFRVTIVDIPEVLIDLGAVELVCPVGATQPRLVFALDARTCGNRILGDNVRRLSYCCSGQH